MCVCVLSPPPCFTPAARARRAAPPAQRDLDTANDTLFGPNVTWVRRHFENMELSPSAFSKWTGARDGDGDDGDARGGSGGDTGGEATAAKTAGAHPRFASDVPLLEEHFDGWHRPQPFPMISLR